ncbi:MAG: Na/Pi cotransporter family protein, partial [Clostridia bacterium]|nr:Na/Pi cotransporter family protein [Clostridia bacterium]
MTIFNVLSLIGGLSLFLFGMNIMGNALEKRAGSRLKKILASLTSSPIKGLMLGLAVTAVIQSSSATTVMVVGFVNSGIMTLRQAINVIMGANIGTTVTAWMLSLTGISGDSLFIQLLKPTSFTPILALIGAVMYLFLKDVRKKDTGEALLGFAVLMFGMDAMSAAVKPLAAVPEFGNILIMLSNPIFGVLAGALLTAIIQSSSASVGILQALSATGQVTFGSAIPIIMGQNIGTCVTALLSSVGTTKGARRAAMVHLYFNILGTVVLLILFNIANGIFDFAFVHESANQAGIAIVHTVFNLSCTALLFPFGKQLERLACATVRDDGQADELQMLDERLLATPAAAIMRCTDLTHKMARKSCTALADALAILRNYDSKAAQKIYDTESKVDEYEDKLGDFLVKLSAEDMNADDSREASTLLHLIGDFERISDHAVNLVESAEELNSKGLSFSAQGKKEIEVLYCALEEILQLTQTAMCERDMQAAALVESLEQVIDHLKKTIKMQHVMRLKNGQCTIEVGFVLNDILTCMERTSDHCSNIAACIL